MSFEAKERRKDRPDRAPPVPDPLKRLSAGRNPGHRSRTRQTTTQLAVAMLSLPGQQERLETAPETKD